MLMTYGFVPRIFVWQVSSRFFGRVMDLRTRWPAFFKRGAKFLRSLTRVKADKDKTLRKKRLTKVINQHIISSTIENHMGYK